MCTLINSTCNRQQCASQSHRTYAVVVPQLHRKWTSDEPHATRYLPKVHLNGTASGPPNPRVYLAAIPSAYLNCTASGPQAYR